MCPISLPIYVDAYSGFKATDRPRHFTLDEEADEWTLQSGFDGEEPLSRPSIELVTADSAIAKKAEQRIELCEHCHPADAEIPFDWLLAEVTGRLRRC